MTGKIKKLRLVTAMVLAVLMVVLIPVQAGAIAMPGLSDAENQVFGTQEGNEIDAQEEETKPAEILAEVEEDRDEYTKHFRMDNGSFMAVQYEYPVHYKDKDGEWAEYDNTMKEAPSENSTDAPSETGETAPVQTESTDASITPATESDSFAMPQNETNIAAVNETEAATAEITQAPTDAEEPASLDADENAEYENKKSDLDIRLSKKAKKNNMVKIKGDGYQVSWGFPGINKSRVEFVDNDEKLEGNDKFLVRKNLVQEALYKNAFPNVDLQYLVTPVGIKENIILKSKDAQTEFELAYKIQGLTASKKNDFTIELKDKDGKVVYEIYAPFMTDNKGEKSTQLRMEIKEQKNHKLTVVLSADKEWLAETERDYPIVIDPSFNTSNAWQNTACSYIDSAHPSTAYGYGSESGYTGTVYTGTFGQGNYRTYLKMNSLPTLNKGDMVVASYLNMHLYQSSFYDDMYVGAYHVSGAWKQSSITWNNKPGFESTTVDYERMYKGIGTDGDPWVDWDVTKSVKRWYNGEANNGIMLKPVDEATNAQCASFYSSNYPSTSIPRPVFTIVYRNNKGLEDYWSYTSFNIGTAGTAYINDYTGNLVFVHQDMATGGSRMPLAINHVYNNYMADTIYDKTSPKTGRGWRMSVQQSLLPSSQFGLKGDAAERYPYVYTDGDGTDHYIYNKGTKDKPEYADEDGMKLKLTINTNSKVARYVLKDEKDNSMEFNTNGLLVKILNANGDFIYVGYDTDSKTIKYVQDGAGRRITFVPNPGGTGSLSQLQDPAGRLKTFYYPSAGRIAQIKNPDGTSVYFTYDDDGSITSVKDIDGYTMKFGYSSLASGKQVINVVEYGTDGTVGQRVTFDRKRYNTTIVHSSGNDGIYSNDEKADDLYTTMQFDNWGRTTSIKSRTGQKDLGAAGCQYTSGSPNSSGSNLSQINRVTNEYNLGSNAINLLTNHNMEVSGTWKTGAWGGTNTFTTAYTAEQRYMGKQSYKINVTAYSGLSSGRAYQDVSNAVLVPGGTYTLSGYVKATSLSTTAANTGAALAVTFFDADGASTGTQFSDYIKSTTDTSINGGWRRVNLTFTVPSNADFTRINLALRGATGTAYFDALQLEKYNNANTYNMLENSSLDNYGSGALPTGWSGNDLTASDGKNTSSQNGAYAFKMVGDPAKNKELVQSVNITGNEGDTYIVSGWAKANAVPENDEKSKRFKISVRIVYSTGDPVWKQAAEFNRSISDWQFTSSAFTLDDGTTANRTPVRIDVYVRYHQQCNTAYFDNIQLIKDVSQSYTYDKDGHLITAQKNAEQKSKMEYNNADLTKSIDAKGYAYTYEYNDQHNMTKATSQRGLTYNYTYGKNSKGDADGIPTELEVLNPNKEAALKSTVSYTSDKAYVTKSTDQHGTATNYTYDQNRGTLLSAADSTGTVNYTYDANNNLLKKVSMDIDGGMTTVQNQYVYTSGTSRNLIRIGHNGTNYGISYDVFNNKTKTMVGSQALATYTYGANNGLLQKQAYGTGQYVGFTYDAFGNMDTKSYNGTTAFKWFADRTGAVTRHQDLINKIQYDSDYDVTGRLVRQSAMNMDNSQSISSLEYGYDANNNVSKLVNITSNKTARNAYVYGKDNLPEKYTIDNSRDVTYSYDSLNRLKKISIATTTPITMEYNQWKSNRNTGDSIKYKTTQISEENIAGEKLGYYYDERGNITNIRTMTYNADGTEAGYRTDVATYQYDELGQLVFEKNGVGSEQRTYTYDIGGNLLNEKFEVLSGGRVVSTTNTNYAYGDSNWKDKLTSYDGKAITYDEIGNPLSYRNMTMTWQNGRQLATLQKGSTAVSYTYDAGSVRRTKTVNGVKHTYQYLDGRLIHETRGDKTFNYYYDAMGYLTGIKYRLTPDGTEYSYLVTHNWRGDIIGIYSGSGVLTAKYEYDTWGKVKSVKDGNGNRITDQNNVGNLNPFRYRGYYYDTESQLYYLMSRYYDPVTHRFINADGYFQSGNAILDANMNAYCGNNPVNRFDPDGNCWIPTYSTCGAQMGSYWMTMQPVPGASYYCNKCGNCDPNYKSNKSDKSELDSQYTPNISVAYGSMTGTTKSGWYWRIDSTNTNTLTERHIVIQKGKFKYAQNLSGRPHDGSSGSPPNTVKKELKKQGIWDWDANEAKRPKISKCTSFISLDTYYANQQLQNNFYLGVCVLPGSTFSSVLSTSAATSGGLVLAFA